MKKLHISFLHNLHHVEFKTFYSNLLRLMQGSEFTDATLTELLERLQSQKEDVDSLRRNVEPSYKTPIIAKLSRLRTDYLISLRLEIKAKKLSYIPEMRPAAKRLHTWLKSYKKEPYIQSIITQDIVVDSILGSIRENESLRADIALLQLDGLINAIAKTTQQIGLNVKHRAQDKVSKNKLGRDLRDAAYDEIRILANYLHYKVSLIEGTMKESEHFILLLKIDMQLRDIRKIFRIRTVKDKTRKEKEAAKQLQIDKPIEMKQPEAVVLSPQPKPTNIVLTETQKELLPSESLPDITFKASPKIIAKKKKEVLKPKMKRRKIR